MRATSAESMMVVDVALLVVLGYPDQAGAARLVRDGGTPTMPTEATREQVRQLVAAGAQVVDVLPAAEYRSTHLPGAINLPLKELDARTDQLDRSRPVIVYCHDTV